jgi:hypothetical protein
MTRYDRETAILTAIAAGSLIGIALIWWLS